MNVAPAPLPRPINAMRSAMAICLGVMLGTAGPAFSQAANADPVVAIVNGTQIHESDVQLVDEIIGRNLPSQDRVERRDSILKMVIDTTLLAQVANERKIIEDADIQRRITFARNQGLMNHLLMVVGQQAATDDAIRKAYEDVVLKPAQNEVELHLRHLVFLFRDPRDDAAVKAAEDKAEKALARVKAGEDFAAVVADVSEDPVTKAKGGDFGWRTRPEMGKEYAEAAFAMKNGDVSPLIKTAVGWHIIQLEDQRVRKPVELDKIKDRVAAMVANTAQFELVKKTRETAKIELMDRADGPKAAPQGQ